MKRLWKSWSKEDDNMSNSSDTLRRSNMMYSIASLGSVFSTITTSLNTVRRIDINIIIIYRSYHCQWHWIVNEGLRGCCFDHIRWGHCWKPSRKFFGELWRNDINRDWLTVSSQISPLRPLSYVSSNDQYHDLDTTHKALNGEQAETVIFAPHLTRHTISQSVGCKGCASVTQIVENVWGTGWGDTGNKVVQRWRWLYSEIMTMRRHELCVPLGE